MVEVALLAKARNVQIFNTRSGLLFFAYDRSIPKAFSTLAVKWNSFSKWDQDLEGLHLLSYK